MKKLGKSIIIITILFALVFIFSNCVSAAEPTKTLITKTSTGGTADSQSTNPYVSPNGRYVAFESYASNIGNGSSGRGIQDIYVYDKLTNKTEWITHTPSGGAANGNSYNPTISDNGLVAFASEATNLGPGGSGNNIKDIYVYDLVKKNMTWITHTPSGGAANGASNYPVISGDGKWLAFQSTAKNLGTGGSEYYVSDIYIYNLNSTASNNYPQWITHTTEGKTANGASMNPSINANGRYIVFETQATNLGPDPYIRYGTGDNIKDIFRYDRDTGKMQWITGYSLPIVEASPSGGVYNLPRTVTLSFKNGETGTIFYQEGTSDWLSGPAPLSITITSSTYLTFYGRTNEGIYSYTRRESYISNNENFAIVWATPGTGMYFDYVNVTLHMNKPGQIYYTTDGSSPTILSENSTGDGGTIRINSTTTLKFIGLSQDLLISAPGEETYIIIPRLDGTNPSISADGNLIAYEWGGLINLLNVTTNNRTTITHTVEGNSPNGTSKNPSISGNGKYIAFESLANNLGPDPSQPYGSNIPGITFWDGNRRGDIFVYDILNDTMNWVTKNPNYGPANGNSYTPSLNYDGTVLAYSSSANNLGPGGSGVYRDIFVEDSGLQVLADKSSGSYEGPLTVTLTLINGPGTIYYTTNGSDPKTSGIVYSGPITITSDTLLRYIGKGTGDVWTLNYSQNYVIIKPVIKISPTVTANPAGGTYTSVITVTLTTIDPDSTATTYYTTDGSDPKTSGTRKTYSNPIQIASTTTLRYVAVDPNGNWSPNYSQTYTINLPKNTVTIAQLNSAAASVRKYYETHSKKLPNSTTINGKTYTMAQFLYLLVTATVNMNTNNLNPITAKTVNSAPRPSGTIKSGYILKTKYVSYAKNIQNFININKRAPNFLITTLGNMQFKYIVYMYTKIVNYYVSNKRLPNSVAMTK